MNSAPYLNAYMAAVKQLRDVGYVTDHVLNTLSPEDLQRAAQEASQSE